MIVIAVLLLLLIDRMNRRRHPAASHVKTGKKISRTGKGDDDGRKRTQSQGVQSNENFGERKPYFLYDCTRMSLESD